MTKHLHLPHPHMPHFRLTEALLAGFAEGVVQRFQHHAPPIVPDGHDWTDWTPTHTWLAEHGGTGEQ